MAIKTHNGTSFSNISDVRAFDGAEFKSVNAVNVYNGTAWEKVFPDGAVSGTVKTWNVLSVWTYLNSGSRQSAHLHEPIQGSYDGTAANARRSILLFDYAAIQAALKNAKIEKVELYLKRLNTSHGQATAYAAVKTHNYSSAPTKWTGSDLGDADSGSPSFTRGQGKWVELNNAVGENLRDGTIKGLCLDADSNYALSRYIKYSSDIKLRITYSK